MRQTPADELSWVARAEARLAKDAGAALADVEEALRLNPASMYGLQLKAHILAERQGKPDEAIRVLDRAVELYPEYAPAVAGRGVLLARAGRRVEAVRDAEVALVRDSRAPNLYQVGCIYALIAKAEPGPQGEGVRTAVGRPADRVRAGHRGHGRGPGPDPGRAGVPPAGGGRQGPAGGPGPLSGRQVL